MRRTLVAWSARILSFAFGASIVYHEVWISDTAEPLLFVGGLWLSGAPIADLLDKLRRLAVLPSPSEPPAGPGVEVVPEGQNGDMPPERRRSS